MGIEPTSEAWEASILPLYDARSLNSILLRIDRGTCTKSASVFRPSGRTARERSGENDAFAVTLHEFAKKGFAAAVGVDIGGVYEVAAHFAADQKPILHGVSLFWILNESAKDDDVRVRRLVRRSCHRAESHGPSDEERAWQAERRPQADCT